MDIRHLSLIAGFAGALAAPLSAQVTNFDSLNSYSAPLEMQMLEAQRLPDLVDTMAPSVFVAGLQQSGGSDQEPGRYDRDFDKTSFYLGLSHDMGEWTLGLLGGLFSGEVDALEINPGVPDPATGHTETDGWIAALFTTYKTERLTFILLGGFGGGENDMDRSSDLGPVFGNSFGEFDTEFSFLSATLKGDFDLDERWTLTPYGTLGFSAIDADELTETGGPDRRIIEAFDDSQTYIQIGVEIGSGAEWYAPVLDLGWWHDFSDDGIALDVSAIDTTYLGQLVVPPGARNLFIASLGIEGEIEDGWKLALHIDFATGDGSDLIGFGGAIGYDF